MINADTMTYRFCAVLALLLNVLASVMLLMLVRQSGVYWTVPPGVVCNLASYVLVISAIRHPWYVR